MVSLINEANVEEENEENEMTRKPIWKVVIVVIFGSINNETNMTKISYNESGEVMKMKLKAINVALTISAYRNVCV